MSAKRSSRYRKSRQRSWLDCRIPDYETASSTRNETESSSLWPRLIGSSIVFTLFIAGLCFAFPLAEPSAPNKPQQTALASSANPANREPLARLAELNRRIPTQANAMTSLAAQEGLPGGNLQLAGFGGGGNDEIVSNYTYDGNGLRRSATVTQNNITNTTNYLYDGTNMVRTFKNGGPGETYLTGLSGPVYRRDDVTGQIRWYLFDGIGNAIGEVDPQGNITASRKYDAYGSVRGGVNASGTSRHKFQGSVGHLSDDETGLVYMRGRYYDPVIGRFLSEDAWGDGKNLFAYTHNNPINHVDYDGHIIIAGPLAIAEGMDVEAGEGAGAQAAYNWLTNKIAQSVGKRSAQVALELLEGNPAEWSAGEYQFLKDQAMLLIRINGNLPKSEIAQIFCREVAEFLQRNASGVLTKDVWTKFGPEMYNELISFF